MAETGQDAAEIIESYYGFLESHGFDVEPLRAAARELRRMIRPLQRSDDPEEAEAVRMTQDYVLYDRKAYDREQALQHGWRDERDRLREALSKVQLWRHHEQCNPLSIEGCKCGLRAAIEALGRASGAAGEGK